MHTFPECGEPFHPDACEPEDYGYDPETGDPYDQPDRPLTGGGDGHPTEQVAEEMGWLRQRALDQLVATIRAASRELALLMAEMAAEGRDA